MHRLDAGSAGHVTRLARATGGFVLALAMLAGCGTAGVSASRAPLESLPSLDLPSYLGTWYQVLWYPNAFQRACVSDTSARYRVQAGEVIVHNLCRRDGGRVDAVKGVARPVGRLVEGRLEPAQLDVSFLPEWLQWLPFGWAPYWVIHLADDGRYAVVSEPGRQYLWVLSRGSSLSPADETAIRSRLEAQGFDTIKLVPHPHPTPIP